MKTTFFIISILLIFSYTNMVSGKEKTDKNKSSNFVLLPVKQDPTISFRFWFKVGSQNDPQGKEGLALLTAMMLTDAGTMNNSYENLLEKLYPMAASYGSKVDKEMTVIYGRIYKDNLKTYYSLFSDAILKPAFAQEDFKRIKSNVLNYIENDLRYSSDEELGKAALYQFIFRNTSYEHLTEGSIQGLNNITLEDVKNFYNKYYTKENVVFGIGGCYDNNLVKKVQNDFSKLPEGKVNVIQKPIPKKFDGLNLFIVNKKCDATAISFGFPINVLRGDEDFFSLALFVSWFGEHRNSSSHLYQVIREQRGMNYGDYAYIEKFLDGSSLQMPDPNNPRRQQIFEVWLRPVQHIHRHFVLRAALRELKKVVDNGMSKEDFEITKKFLNKYALNYAQTTNKKLGYAIDSKFYGIDKDGDYISYFRKKINALTLEQVNNAIKKHIQYNDIKIAIITDNAEAFKDELIKDTPSPIKYDTPKPSSVIGEDKQIEKFPLKILPEKVKIVKVEDMFVK